MKKPTDLRCMSPFAITATILGLTLACAILASCGNPFAYFDKLEGPDDSPTGSVTVSLGENDGRTIAPVAISASSVAFYNLALARDGYATIAKEKVTDLSAVKFESLAAGAWTLTVEAYASGGGFLAKGSAQATVEAGKTSAVSVALSGFAQTAGKNGTVSLSFTADGFSFADKAWSISFSPVAGGNAIILDSSSSGATVDSSANTLSIQVALPSGDYDMTFSVAVNGTSYVRLADTVKVYDGRTSVASGAIALSVADLAKAGTVYYVTQSGAGTHSGLTTAQACTFEQALARIKANPLVSPTNPGTIVLSENITVTFIVENPQGIDIVVPTKITSASSAVTPYALKLGANISSGGFLNVHASAEDSTSGALTLERITVIGDITNGYYAEYGLVSLIGELTPSLTMNAESCLTKNHSVSFGGGVYALAGTISMNPGSSIVGNESNLNGGGVYLDGGTLILQGGTISGNSAFYGGGGVYGSSLGEVRLVSGSIVNNAIDEAGAIPGVLASNITGASSWAGIVRDNVGIGPQLAKYVEVSDANSLKTIMGASAAYAYPLFVNLLNSFSILNGITISNAANAFFLNSTDGESFLSAMSGVDSSLFTVSAGKLWIDCVLSGYTGNQFPLVKVSGGTVVLGPNSRLENNVILIESVPAGIGGGALVSSGTLQMEGGEITSCTALSGGGVGVIDQGTFIMNGGSIYSNGAGSTGRTNGGGVYVNDGTFTMNGGEIGVTDSPNVAIMGGAGVYAHNGATVSITGGTIAHNTTSGEEELVMGGGIYLNNSTCSINGGEISGNYSYSFGGGIAVCSGAELTMTGGSIGVSSSPNTATCGGGVFVSTGTVTMSSGSIGYNEAEGQGGGIYAYHSTLSISGNSAITNNFADNGGGAYIINTTTLALSGSAKVDYNDAMDVGGGVYACDANTKITLANTASVSNNGISGSTGDLNGGGITLCNSSSLTMNGGEINSNTITGITSSASGGGGGVYASSSSITMNAGSVSNNTVSSSSTNLCGGGIYLDNASLTINDGSIDSNILTGVGVSVTRYGGGVYAIISSITMNGGEL